MADFQTELNRLRAQDKTADATMAEYRARVAPAIADRSGAGQGPESSAPPSYLAAHDRTKSRRLRAWRRWEGRDRFLADVVDRAMAFFWLCAWDRAYSARQIAGTP